MRRSCRSRVGRSHANLLAVQVRHVAAPQRHLRRRLHDVGPCPTWPRGCLVFAPNSGTGHRKATIHACAPAQTRNPNRRRHPCGQVGQPRHRVAHRDHCPTGAAAGGRPVGSAYLDMPELRHQRVFLGEALKRRSGIGVILVVKQPARSHGCVKNEHPAGSETVALVPSRQNLFARHPGGLPSCACFEKPSNGVLPLRAMGNRGRQMRHDSPVARDGNCRTTFNPAKKLCQVSLRIGGLNLLNHEWATGCSTGMDHTPPVALCGHAILLPLGRGNCDDVTRTGPSRGGGCARRTSLQSISVRRKKSRM